MADIFSYDVFMSHSSKDKAAVREVAERLRRDGLKVWFDEWLIKPGDSIPAKIDEGLENSRVLLLCMSANALGSDWALLESQTFRFRDPLNKDRRLIPLRLDNAPIKGSLGQFLYIDWLAQRDHEYQRLLEACRLPEIPKKEPQEGTTACQKADYANDKALRDLRSRFLEAQDRFPREVSFALVMIPHDEMPAWLKAKEWFDDFPFGPPREFGWKCLAFAGGGDTPETISIPTSERMDGGNCPLLYNLDTWRCWLFRQSKNSPYPDRALNIFYSLAADACRLLDVRDCGMVHDGHRIPGRRGEYHHLLRWSIEQLDAENCPRMTWLDPPHEHVRTTWKLGHRPRRWVIEMPCVLATVVLALERQIQGMGKLWPPC